MIWYDIKNKNIKDAVIRLFFFLGLIVSAYTFLLALLARSLIISKVPSYLYAIVILILIPIIIKFRNVFLNIGIKKFFFIILPAAFFLRLFWAIIFKPLPVSDFEFYHLYAVNISKGIFEPYDNTCLIFPHRFGLPFFLGFLYYIFGPNINVAVIFNILCSTATLILIYYFGTYCFNEYTARIAAVIYAFWPAQIMYSSVVSTEILFVFLYMGSLVFFLKVLKEPFKKAGYNILFIFLSGVLLALSHFIRPVTLLFLAVYIFVILFKIIPDIKANLLNAVSLPVILCGYIIVLLIGKSLIFNATGVPFKTSSGYNFLVGTNYSSSGVYNNEDAALIRKYNYDFNMVHSQCRKTAINRIILKPYEFIRLIEKKYMIMWGDETYGASWSLTNKNIPLVSNYLTKKISVIVSQVYYLIILLMAFYGIFKIRNKANILAAIPLLIFFGHVCAYSLFEVQSRYHYPAIVLMLLYSAEGIKLIPDKLIHPFRTQ